MTRKEAVVCQLALKVLSKKQNQRHHSKIIGLDCCNLFGILGLLSLQHPLSPLAASLLPLSRQLWAGYGDVLSSPEE